MLPFLGHGIGLRACYYDTILQTFPSTIDWFEITTEDYLVAGGRPLYFLEKIREHYPITMHGVSLSVGAADPLDMNYLANLKKLARRIEPVWISDHLGWTGIHGLNTHDILPLPYTEETIKHLIKKIKQVQDYLGCKILLENVPSYINYLSSEIPEWEFINIIANEADCLLLIDINNIYVNSFNLGFNPLDYLKGLSNNKIQQFHLAGHERYDKYLLDSHDEPIIKSVWKLYEEALKLFGVISTSIERDGNFPPFSELLTEVEYARKLASNLGGECSTNQSSRAKCYVQKNTTKYKTHLQDIKFKLHSIQNAFQNYLLSCSNEIDRYIGGDSRELIYEQLSIYGASYPIRLIDSLALNFPHLKFFMGQDTFESMCNVYLSQFPSHSFSIRNFGESLYKFLITFDPYKNNSVLAEIALFEWTLINTIEAADASVVTLEQLKLIPKNEWCNLQFVFHPSVNLIDLKWNMPNLWQAFRNDEKPLSPIEEPQLITWTVWRNHIIGCYRKNNLLEAWVMRAIERGYSFGKICEGLEEWLSNADLKRYASKLIISWLNDGMFTKIKMHIDDRNSKSNL